MPVPINGYELAWNPQQGPGYRLMTPQGWTSWTHVSAADLSVIAAILQLPAKMFDPTTNTVQGHP